MRPVTRFSNSSSWAWRALSLVARSLSWLEVVSKPSFSMTKFFAGSLARLRKNDAMESPFTMARVLVRSCWYWLPNSRAVAAGWAGAAVLASASPLLAPAITTPQARDPATDRQNFISYAPRAYTQKKGRLIG